jgi:phosphoadenosine phosphosulfate reductase
MAFSLKDYPNLDVRAEAERFEAMTLDEILTSMWERFGARAQIGTSYQGSGLVIIHHARRLGLDFPVFTIDTGLLFPETYELKSRLESFFGIEIKSLKPSETVDEQRVSFGSNLWETNPDTCCTLRKVLPLQQHLGGIDVWVTGLRRNQGDTRSQTRILELYEFDKIREEHILKLNPMANWTREAVWAEIKEAKIPYNPLHDRGYRTIGCSPCTKVSGGDGERAGRWEGFDKTECGIHTFLGSNI